MSKRRKFIQETNRTFGIMNPIVESKTGTVFEMSIDSLQKFKSQLYTLILTNKGERPMMPTFGTQVQRTLFEPFSTNTLENIRLDIVRSVGQWIPEIIIDEVVFEDEEENQENNRINLSINYSLKVNSELSDQLQIEMSL